MDDFEQEQELIKVEWGDLSLTNNAGYTEDVLREADLLLDQEETLSEERTRECNSADASSKLAVKPCQEKTDNTCSCLNSNSPMNVSNNDSDIKNHKEVDRDEKPSIWRSNLNDAKVEKKTNRSAALKLKELLAAKKSAVVSASKPKPKVRSFRETLQLVKERLKMEVEGPVLMNCNRNESTETWQVHGRNGALGLGHNRNMPLSLGQAPMQQSPHRPQTLPSPWEPQPGHCEVSPHQKMMMSSVPNIATTSNWDSCSSSRVDQHQLSLLREEIRNLKEHQDLQNDYNKLLLSRVRVKNELEMSLSAAPLHSLLHLQSQQVNELMDSKPSSVYLDRNESLSNSNNNTATNPRFIDTLADVKHSQVYIQNIPRDKFVLRHFRAMLVVSPVDYSGFRLKPIEGCAVVKFDSSSEAVKFLQFVINYIFLGTSLQVSLI